MASGGSGKNSRGRGRRRPRGGGRPGGGPKGPPAATHSPRRGKAFSSPYEVPDSGPIDPFDLFCACFIGLMPDGTYRGAGLAEVAKRFRRTPGELKQMLDGYGLDPETLKGVDFDLSLAKLDIQVAPEGMDRRELARGLFEEFCDLHPTLTCAPIEVTGNGGRPGGHAPDPPEPEADRRHHGAQGADQADSDHGEGEPPDEGPMDEAPEGDDRMEADGLDEAPEEDEAPADAPLATADVGVERTGGPAGHGPTGGSHSPQGAGQGRPVRQIRRSPTRRGRG